MVRIALTKRSNALTGKVFGIYRHYKKQKIIKRIDIETKQITLAECSHNLRKILFNKDPEATLPGRYISFVFF